MDRTRTVTIDLPEALLFALGQAARTAGCSPSDYLRATLRAALDRTPARLRAEDEAIRHAVHLARDWLDLQRRLRAAGHVLRLAPEGGLAPAVAGQLAPLARECNPQLMGDAAARHLAMLRQ